MKKIVAVIAAHPDDEVLGAGGTLARHAQDGDEIYVVFMTNGVEARGSSARAGERAQAAMKACECLGITRENICFRDFPDNKMDSVPRLEIVKSIETFFSAVPVNTVYTHCRCDLNVDHQVVHEAVMTAFRFLPDTPISEIYSFEVLSSTEWSSSDVFRPNYFVDIDKYLDAKLKAMACYSMELRSFPHPRSIEAITAQVRLRGAHAGLKAAEAFELVRRRNLQG